MKLSSRTKVTAKIDTILPYKTTSSFNKLNQYTEY